MNSLFRWIGRKLLGRAFYLDRQIPVSVLLARAFVLLLGLLRGMVLTGRWLVLRKGARISDVRALGLSGGLVRIEDHARIECTSRDGVRLGKNFRLGAFSRIIASGTLSDLGRGVEIGDNVGIGEFAYIGGAGGVKIGSDTIIGQYFSVHPEDHIFNEPDQAIREQGLTRKGITVGSSCWIGAKVTILDGATIGNHCVLAAGSVVTKSFSDHSVIGGVPARLLKSLKPENKEVAHKMAGKNEASV